MDSKTVIKSLKNIKILLLDNHRWKNERIAIDLGIKAIEKQTPKKNIGEYRNECPICEAIVENGYDFYCHMCGQRLEK